MLDALSSSEWSLDHAAHLLSRAGFGGTPDQARALHALGLDAAVDSLLDADAPQLPPPDWTRDAAATKKAWMRQMAAAKDFASKEELRKAAARRESRQIQQLRAWWLERMRQGRRPLLEKMTLFWHGHFATSMSKVKDADLMWRQNETLRAHALGSFAQMLSAMTRDPAMIRWLDLGRSRKGSPNENFAREVLELFTLGEGHYTESDIKDGARAFTGHRIDPITGEFYFVRRLHDYGTKTFLGRTGKFDADGIVAAILAQDQCARFLARRIWEFLAYENPEPAVLEAAAAALRGANYEVKPLLGALFRSRAFYSAKAMRTQIKSPVDWLVNTCIVLDTQLPSQPALDYLLGRLGQLPFAPPNVRGWEGGKSWISSSTLLLRYNFVAAVMGQGDHDTRRMQRKADLAPVDIKQVAPPPLRGKPDELAAALVFRIFGTPELPRMQASARQAIEDFPQPLRDHAARVVCRQLMSTPDFQLT